MNHIKKSSFIIAITALLIGISCFGIFNNYPIGKESSQEFINSIHQLDSSDMLSITGGCEGGTCVLTYIGCPGCGSVDVPQCDGGSGYCVGDVIWLYCYCGGYYWETLGC